MSIDSEKDLGRRLFALADEHMRFARRKMIEAHAIIRDSCLSTAEFEVQQQVWIEHFDEHHADGGACRHAIRGSE